MENDKETPGNSGFMQGWGLILLIIGGVIGLLVLMKVMFNI
jgi:Tfp pilus assembly protein PilW